MSLSKVKTRDYPESDPKRGVNYIKTITSNTYTLRNEDKGCVLVFNIALNGIVTVPQLSVPIGSQIDFFRTGAGSLNFSAGAGVTILSDGLNLATTNTGATLIKTGDTTYLLVGKLT